MQLQSTSLRSENQKSKRSHGEVRRPVPRHRVSHFVPMMRLADVLLDASYAVTVALIDPTLKQDIAFAAAVDHARSLL
jgi:hypothetical protein